ncbi:MAG TPA: hypothetical protein PK569_12845, partial [Thermoanaerobaculia bacterium]|nr:hypothetical protein [Thermoanaerobaculia bacterium]
MKELFLSPAWLWATLGGALLAATSAWLSARRVRRRREGLVAPALAEKAGLLARDRWTAFAALLAVIATLGTGLAMARPRWGLVTETGGAAVLRVEAEEDGRITAAARLGDEAPQRGRRDADCGGGLGQDGRLRASGDGPGGSVRTEDG